MKKLIEVKSEDGYESTLKCVDVPATNDSLATTPTPTKPANRYEDAEVDELLARVKELTQDAVSVDENGKVKLMYR